ncbi:MAG: lectin-like domain-containing protein [Flavisolibacter sp.]
MHRFLYIYPVNRRLIFFFQVLTLLCSTTAFPQYILNGNATRDNCNCYTLTREQEFQSGSVWNSNKISLNQPFDFWFNVYLGCSDAGADGIVFMLQPLSTSIGTSGEGMGFDGVKPSIGIALDTWQNFNQNDPAADHISIQANGQVNHNFDLAGPVQMSISNPNVEDCQWHQLRITWDPATQKLQAFFDNELRVETQKDLIKDIFNNDPMVYWGFSGATGGAFNVQQFCTALNPDFKTGNNIDGGCAPATVQFSSNSVSFAPIASYEWDFGNGETSTQASPPPQLYPDTGTFEVKLKIRGMDGCENEMKRNVIIGSVPLADVSVADICFGGSPAINYSTDNAGVTYTWQLDGADGGNGAPPTLSALSAGSHKLQLTVHSLYGCGADAVAEADFGILYLPEIEITQTQECRTVQFSGVQTDKVTTIAAWQWQLGDGSISADQAPQHTYATAGNYSVQSQAVADNGCLSEPAVSVVSAPEAIVNAGRDTLVMKDQPYQLNGSGNGTFEWTPPALLSNPFTARPVTTLSADQEFVLTVITAEGCEASDSVKIRVLKGPEVYVPSAFTPNNDGRNDALKPVVVGISSVERFSVYNRWGQEVFRSNGEGSGWDGRFKGLPQNGTFVWVVKAVNYLNEAVVLKGTVTIIR